MATQIAGVSGTTSTSGLGCRQWRRLREVSLGYFLLAPAFLLLVVFEFYPVLYGFYISLCRWRATGCLEMIGAGNYQTAIEDPQMWASLWTTTMYSAISVPLQLSIGLFIAYLLFQNIRGKEALRVMFFLPYITSTVASAAVWAYLYSPDKGLINLALKSIGLPTLRWLGEARGVFEAVARTYNPEANLPSGLEGPPLALVALLIYTTWVFVGYDITIFLAGLGNIPPELYDAAKVDGASGWKLFRYVTFPLLSPTTFFLLILTVIGTFKAFNHIWVMTQGGPVDVTNTSAIYIFQQLYQNNRYGYSAALSFILFAVILALTLVQNRVAGSRVVYD